MCVSYLIKVMYYKILIVFSLKSFCRLFNTMIDEENSNNIVWLLCNLIFSLIWGICGTINSKNYPICLIYFKM